MTFKHDFQITEYTLDELSKHLTQIKVHSLSTMLMDCVALLIICSISMMTTSMMTSSSFIIN